MTGKTRDNTLFLTAVLKEKMEPHCAVRPSKRRMTFPDILFLRKCCVKEFLNNPMLTCHDFLFMLKSDLWFKPSANSCLLLTPCILKLGAKIDLNYYNPLSYNIFTLLFLC